MAYVCWGEHGIAYKLLLLLLLLPFIGSICIVCDEEWLDNDLGKDLTGLIAESVHILSDPLVSVKVRKKTITPVPTTGWAFRGIQVVYT